MPAAPSTVVPSHAPSPVVLGSLQRRLRESAELEPRIDAVEPMTKVVRDGEVVVVRARGIDLEGGTLRCRTTTAGYCVELLDLCTRYGNDVLLGIRVMREQGASALGCELELTAGPRTVHTTVMVRPRES
jgi:hypothetical protein